MGFDQTCGLKTFHSGLVGLWLACLRTCYDFLMHLWALGYFDRYLWALDILRSRYEASYISRYLEVDRASCGH